MKGVCIFLGILFIFIMWPLGLIFIALGIMIPSQAEERAEQADKQAQEERVTLQNKISDLEEKIDILVKEKQKSEQEDH